MDAKDLNRLKVVLAEKKRTNKWLAEQLGKDPSTVSKWVTNNPAQPSNFGQNSRADRMREAGVDNGVSR